MSTPEVAGDDALVIQELIALVRLAGEAILQVYHRSGKLHVENKADDSPLTLADLAAHTIIVEGLAKILDLPMISEESPLPSVDERKKWSRYWLIDPLDGTKEFILGSGEFTVNIAMIEDGVPVLGAVHLPTENVTYLGVHKNFSKTFAGAWKYANTQSAQKINVRSLKNTADETLVVLASHRHGTEPVRKLLQDVEKNWSGKLRVIHAGSSIKFCLIAEGKADFYPRLSPTSEWDTAAAQAVLCAAGGSVVATNEAGTSLRLPLVYNQHNTIINPDFFALGDSHFDWQSLLRLSDKN